MSSNRYLKEAIQDVVDRKLRLVDFMDAGSEACDELGVNYVISGGKRDGMFLRKLSLAKRAFDAGYKRLRKIYHNG